MTDNENNLAKDINVPHKEQMIIDGVDVINCEYFNSKYEGCHCYNTKQECYAINPNKHTSCKGINCYYKQLQREKQNSQEAMDASIREFNRAEELKTLLKRKEQECENTNKPLLR